MKGDIFMPRWDKDKLSPLGHMRATAGYSRETAAYAMHLSLSTMVRYETGITDIPIGIAEEMAILYHVTFDNLREAIKATKEEKFVNVIGRHKKILNQPKIAFSNEIRKGNTINGHN